MTAIGSAATIKPVKILYFFIQIALQTLHLGSLKKRLARIIFLAAEVL